VSVSPDVGAMAIAIPAFHRRFDRTFLAQN
jgi:hypothetical protein